jgi:hypothetical protein
MGGACCLPDDCTTGDGGYEIVRDGLVYRTVTAADPLFCKLRCDAANAAATDTHVSCDEGEDVWRWTFADGRARLYVLTCPFCRYPFDVGEVLPLSRCAAVAAAARCARLASCASTAVTRFGVIDRDPNWPGGFGKRRRTPTPLPRHPIR